MIATVTIFKLRHWWRYFSFFRYTFDAVKQARRSGGIVHMRIRPFRLMTLTVWEHREDMLSFRNSGAHLVAMKQSDSFGTIRSTTWQTSNMPTWKYASDMLSKLPT